MRSLSVITHSSHFPRIFTFMSSPCRLLLCLPLICVAFCGVSQPDTLLQYLQEQSRKYVGQPSANQYAEASRQWPGVEKHFALYDWYINQIRFKFSLDTGLLHLEKAIGVFQDHNETDLARLTWSLRFIYKLNYAPYASLDSMYADLDAHHDKAISKGWADQAFEIQFLKGYKRFEVRDYGAGMELMLHSYNEIQQQGWSSPVIAIILHQYIANSFYKFGDIENCIRYFQAWQRLPVPRTSMTYDYQNLNTIGLCYSKRLQYDSAIHYMTLSMTLAELNKDSFWISLMYGNMGNILFRQGDFERARPYLEKDYHGSRRAGFLGSAANAAMLLANISLQEGKPDEAEEYIRFSKSHKDTFDLVSMSQYLQGQYTYHKMKGDYSLAISYADSLHRLEKRKDLVLDKSILDQAEIRVKIANYKSEVKLLEAARDKQILMRNGLVIILLLSAVIAMLWISRILRKRRSALEKLSLAQQELNRYTKSILEKNEMIQVVRDEMERMKKLGVPDADLRSANIHEMIHTPILTDEDWRHVRDLFDAVHPGFLFRLREKFNDLTPAETRLLALTKLQLPVKDMADLLGISPDTIRKTRYRLRKKINLPEEGTLDELVALI
jgi:tetratricopeptide (TPR) repeat protein